FDGINRRLEVWDEADRDGTLIRWIHDRDPDCEPTICTNTVGRSAGARFPLVAGNLALSEGGFERMGYDVRGQLIYEERQIAGLPLVVRREYDNLSRRIRETYPDEGEVALVYDG